MRKLFLLLLLIPFMVKGSEPLNGKTETATTGNTLLLEQQVLYFQQVKFMPVDVFKKKFPFNIPWGISAAGVVAGGVIAYYGSYKEIPSLAISGGAIAIVSGVLALASVSPMAKLFAYHPKTGNQEVVIYYVPAGLSLNYRF